MRKNLKKYVLDARKNQYAVGAFNTSDMEITQAIIAAADEMKAPIFIQVSEKAIDYAGFDNLISIISNEAEKYQIPISLHLDHGSSFEIVEKCIIAGFDSVMFDGSKIPYKENIRITKKIVDMAKKRNILVEAELGYIGKSKNYNEDKIFMTDPKLAYDFCEKTNVDMLAVAFGNAHGIPDPNEKLDFNLLDRIQKIISVPLVFHGASSTSAKDIKKAMTLGISKINIDTDIKLAFSGSIKDFQKKHSEVYDPRKILTCAKKAVEEVVKNKIKQFNSSNKISIN